MPIKAVKDATPSGVKVQAGFPRGVPVILQNSFAGQFDLPKNSDDLDFRARMALAVQNVQVVFDGDSGELISHSPVQIRDATDEEIADWKAGIDAETLRARRDEVKARADNEGVQARLKDRTDKAAERKAKIAELESEIQVLRGQTITLENKVAELQAKLKPETPSA